MDKPKVIKVGIQLTCNRCKQSFTHKEIIESIQKASNGVFMIRGECPKCRSYIKYVPYADSYTIKHILNALYNKEPPEELLENVAFYDDKNKELY